jgi:hypothetical protein
LLLANDEIFGGFPRNLGGAVCCVVERLQELVVERSQGKGGRRNLNYKALICHVG